MNNLTFERVWQDDDFFQIKVTAQSELITASITSYTYDDYISKLSERLSDFPKDFEDVYILG